MILFSLAHMVSAALNDDAARNRIVARTKHYS